MSHHYIENEPEDLKFIEDNAARLERARVIRLVREALAVKPGPYPDRRKVKAVERLLKELE